MTTKVKTKIRDNGLRLVNASCFAMRFCDFAFLLCGLTNVRRLHIPPSFCTLVKAQKSAEICQSK